MNKPLVIGHRGACAYAPENTLAAFNLAFEMGADGVELDVTLTQDGVPVVIHDDTVNRTSDGRGLVEEMPLAELKHLDFGKWLDSKFSGERIPTLAEVLENLPPGKIVNIELKTLALRPWPANAGKLSPFERAKITAHMLMRLWEPARLEPAVVRVVEQTNLPARVLISSFNPIALWRIKRLNPALPRGLLYFKELPFFLGRAWFRPLVQPHALHPRNTTITPQLAQWAHRKGYKINTWTVDDPDEARRLAALGVTGIITNKPDVLRKAFE